MKSNRFWLVILGLVAGACLVCVALLALRATPGTRARILQNGQLLREVALSENTQFTLPAPNGGSNTVTVRDGRICVSHATCPDQVCVKQGWIHTDATPIVCLPNGLVIQIKGGDRDIDGQTG